MLRKLHIQNFRGFEDHELIFERLTLLVGRNNAGKSTVIEALRLVALAVSRHRNVQYRNVPREEFPWIEEEIGFWLLVNEIEFNLQNLFYRYGEPPGRITATFDSKTVFKICINGRGEIFCTIIDEGEIAIRSRAQANVVDVTSLNILPQVAPLALSEGPLTPAYVRRSVSSQLASSHFRNQLVVYGDRFEFFKNLAEENWQRFRIHSQVEFRNGQLNLLVQDDSFVAEVAWMGHGLQIWLQTMWFLARVGNRDPIILDEPDVYLHADLQRRLIRMLKYQRRQSIIATHSIEIISEVDPESVLIIDRKRPSSQFAASLPGVQKVINAVGSVHNIHLARLWTSRKILCIEGKDAAFLRKLQDIIFPETLEPIGAIPQMSIGGWGGWSYVVGSAMLLRNGGGEAVTPYCLLDSDFHLQEDIDKRLAEARRNSIQLHVWKRKEIENYFVIPSAIQRLIDARTPPGRPRPTAEEVEVVIDNLCNSLKDEFFDKYVEEFNRRMRPKNISESIQYARTRVDGVWNSLAAKISLIGGKELIAALSSWSQGQFGVSISAMTLLDHIEGEELDPELLGVLSAIENRTDFPS